MDITSINWTMVQHLQIPYLQLIGDNVFTSVLYLHAKTLQSCIHDLNRNVKLALVCHFFLA